MGVAFGEVNNILERIEEKEKMKKLFSKKSLINLSLVLVMAFAFSLVMNMDAKAAPSRPNGLVQTGASDTTIKMAWNAAAGNGSTVYYVVQVDNDQNDANGIITRDSAYTSVSDTVSGNLSVGTAYYVRVGAYYSSSSNDIAWSDYTTMITAPGDMPSDSVKQTSAGETSITVAWNAVAGATGYSVKYWPSTTSSANAKTVNATKNSITLGGLSKNTEYTVYVYPYKTNGSFTARDDYNYDYQSSLPTLPTKITGVDCDYFNMSVKKGYASFEIDRNNIVDGYQYEIYNNKGKKIYSTKSTSTYLSVTDKDLKTRQFYKIRVRGYIGVANNVVKYGKWSSYEYFTKLNDSDVVLKSSGGKLKASWKKVTGATNYTVYVSTKYNGSYKKMGTTKKTSLTTKTKIKAGKTYYVRVVANKKVGKTTFKATVNSKSSYSAYCYKYKSGRFYYYTY